AWTTSTVGTEWSRPGPVPARSGAERETGPAVSGLTRVPRRSRTGRSVSGPHHCTRAWWGSTVAPSSRDSGGSRRSNSRGDAAALERTPVIPSPPSAEGLVEVGQDVVRVLEPDREPHQVLGHTGGALLVRLELLVGGGRRVDDQRARIADVGQEAEELHPVDERLSLGEAALHPERDQASEAALEVLPRQRVRRVLLETRVANPGHAGVLLEPAGHLERVLRVTAHAQVQGLQTVDEGVRVEGAEGRSEVAQQLDPGLEDEGDVPERLPELEPVVAGVRIG